MKIGELFPGFNISAKGLSIQRKKMNLIAENIANADTIRKSDGRPYKRKFLSIIQKQDQLLQEQGNATLPLKMNRINANHLPAAENLPLVNFQNDSLEVKEFEDNSIGDIVYSPENPNADQDGYVELSNVNIITEMTNMIAATHSYEANLTALNSSKQMIKDTLEI